MSIYKEAGGESAFFELVDTFYARVAEDPVLRPLYPENLEPPKRHLGLFLMQYFGGPQVYSQERGHPRLRARHLPFPVDQMARDHWVQHMREAVDSLHFSEAVQKQLMDYFEYAATFLINQSPPA